MSREKWDFLFAQSRCAHNPLAVLHSGLNASSMEQAFGRVTGNPARTRGSSVTLSILTVNEALRRLYAHITQTELASRCNN